MEELLLWGHWLDIASCCLGYKKYWQLKIVLCCCSVNLSCPTLCDPTDWSTLGFPVLHHLPELAQTRVYWVSDAIQPSHPMRSPSSPAFNFSQHQGFFQWVRWPKYWSFSFSISPSNEYSALIPFRIDWFDRFVVQGTLKSLLQNHSSKASFFWHSAFFIVQLSHPYMTIGITIALTTGTFVGKVMSLLFYAVYVGNSFSSKVQASFNFMAAVTICSDFGA